MSSDQLNDNYVCFKCIGDSFVQKDIKKRKTSNQCNYCGKRRRCINLDALADLVDEVYRRNYRPGKTYPVLEANEDDTSWETAGDDPELIISEMLGCEVEIAQDLVSVLSDREGYDVHRGGDTPYYDSSCTYGETPVYDYEHVESWHHFCEIVKHRSRFFSGSAISLLNELFAGINELNHAGQKAPVRLIDKNSPERFIYRARRANDASKRIKILQSPAHELGAPSSTLAVPGRMNPAGISVFYGALDRATCLSEIRLAVGEAAVSGKFQIIRPLNVLDLTVLKEIYSKLSLFDPDFEQKASRLKFLRGFEAEICMPVLPYEETLGYIPTQAFVEYLANYYTPRIDAVLYSSIQTNGTGTNIAILSHVSAVKQIDDVPVITAIPQFEESWKDVSYFIWDRGTKQEGDPEDMSFQQETRTRRGIEVLAKASLELIPDSLMVHKMTAINPDIDSTPVHFFLAKENAHTDF